MLLAVWLAVAAAGLLLLPGFVALLTAPPYEVAGSESDRASRLLGEAVIQFGREPLLLELHSDRVSRNEHTYRAARTAAVAALERSAGSPR